MDLDSLRCFVAVAHTLHFRAASERLALSPTAVSDRIKRLEDDVGAELFARTTRRVSLTEAGRRLLPHARQLLDDAERCTAVAQGTNQPLPYELVLGTRYELGLSWLTPGLPTLRRLHPERRIHLYMGDTDALVDRLERGLIDAFVLSSRLRRPHLRSVRLHEESYAFVGRDTGPQTAEDAAHHVLIDATPDLPLFQYLEGALPDAPAWRFAEHLYLGGIGGVRTAVLAGMGVAVLPRYFVGEDLAAGRLVELLPALDLPTDWFRLVWRADHPRAPDLEALGGELQALPLR